MRTAALFLLFLVVPPPSAAADIATASGTFRSHTVSLELQSAVAFRGRSFVDQSDALIVAVSDARLNAGAIADYVDRRRVIEVRVKDGKTGIVYFEFSPDGSYRGMSYFLGPGNGCGFCTGDAVSTVKIAGGQLSGRLTAAKDPSFDITLATPVLPDDHGTALASDGGEPGAVYLAYHAALAKADRAALKPLLSRDQQRFWDETEQAGRLGALLHVLALGHPVKSVRIVEAMSAGNKALLVIAGEASVGTIVGEVLLVREAGGWRVDDEITEKVR